MKTIISALVLTLCVSSFAQSRMEYPVAPDSQLTPGSLCDNPSEHRYPEQIAYCERDVAPETKDYVFKEYQRALGYVLGDRHKYYKVDHFIPLCAGGSNHENNLWPQHVTVYTKTDPMEELGCKKLSSGRIKQSELIALFKTAKRNLSALPQVMQKLYSL